MKKLREVRAKFDECQYRIELIHREIFEGDYKKIELIDRLLKELQQKLERRVGLSEPERSLHRSS